MITFTLNGLSMTAMDGQSVAAALISHDLRITRYTRLQGAPRGLFCGIGSCFDCMIVIDGKRNQRSCITIAQEGMVVEVQDGN